MGSSIEYHLKELEIARSQTDARKIVPELLETDRAILDIGCGVGQTFIAMECTDRICVGVDIDEVAIQYGFKHFGDRIQYVLCDATRLPLPSDAFDLVYSRVSLPYTNIPRALREIRRVLRRDGRVWMVLHGRSMAIRYLTDAVGRKDPKHFVHALYVLVNGYLLSWFGLVLPFLDGRYESWQSPTSMQTLLTRRGFDVSVRHVARHTVVEGRRR